MRFFPILIWFIFNTTFLGAQTDVVIFLQAPELASELSKMYLEPIAQMTNGAINSGWYHTAKTHRFWGFDVSLSMFTSSTPSISRGFYLTDIKDFDLYYVLSDGSVPVTPNVAGVSDGLSVIRAKENGRLVEMPNGNGLTKISQPFISAGVGLPYHTELRVRFMPKVKNNDMGKLGQYGFSIKHSIKEYMPVFKDIPALSLAFLTGYTKWQNELSLNYPASELGKQFLRGTSDGYSGLLLVGIDVVVFSAFLGVGYEGSSTEYALKGKYYMGDINKEDEVLDPFVVEYNYSQIEFNVGINAKIGAFDIFIDYSPKDYRAFNFGLGFNVR